MIPKVDGLARRISTFGQQKGTNTLGRKHVPLCVVPYRVPTATAIRSSQLVIIMFLINRDGKHSQQDKRYPPTLGTHSQYKNDSSHMYVTRVFARLPYVWTGNRLSPTSRVCFHDTSVDKREHTRSDYESVQSYSHSQSLYLFPSTTTAISVTSVQASASSLMVILLSLLSALRSFLFRYFRRDR